MSLILDGQIACVIAGIVGSFISLPEEFAVVYCICSSKIWYYGTLKYYRENDGIVSKRWDFDLLLRKQWFYTGIYEKFIYYGKSMVLHRTTENVVIYGGISLYE